MTTYPSFDPTALRAGDLDLKTRTVTIVAGAVLPRGAVLGLATGTLNASLSATASTDGSQVPACILDADVDATAGATPAPAAFIGEFADVECTFGVGHTAATVDLAFALKGQPIFIRSVGSVA